MPPSFNPALPVNTPSKKRISTGFGYTKICMPRRAELHRLVWANFEELLDSEVMATILKKDIVAMTEMQLDEEDEESGSIMARAILRASFAYIEAMVFGLKKMALRLSSYGQGKFTAEELIILKEESYELNEKGEVKAQPKFIPLAKNMRFAFDAGSRALGLHFKLDVGDARWDSFQRALIIRNRITHPKTSADLFFKPGESEHIKNALDWFADNFRRFKEEHGNKIQGALKLAEKLDPQFRKRVDSPEVNRWLMKRLEKLKKKDPSLRRRIEEMMGKKRELVDTGNDKRYVKRDKDGTFKESVDVGRSVAADRRTKSKKTAKPGYGDEGDQPKRTTKKAGKKASKK